MNILYQERSQRARSAELLVAFFVLLLLGAIVFTTYRSYTQGVVQIGEYFIEIVALIVIVKQAVSRYTYILTDTKFIIEEESFFRKRHFEVDYDQIDGVYKFNRDFLTNLHYRYKYRKCSTSDTRPIWAMVYSIEKGRKVKYARVLLKADDAFYDMLNQFVPDRIRVPYEDVVFYATVRADAVKHGEDVKSYYKDLIGEE